MKYIIKLICEKAEVAGMDRSAYVSFHISHVAMTTLYKRMFKKSLSTILQLSTKRTTTFHLDTIITTSHAGGNPGLGFERSLNVKGLHLLW